jgi:hypothetical protein
MSTAVLELKQKVERLTSEERYELMQILEDIEDNALADKAEAEGKFISLDEYKKLCPAKSNSREIRSLAREIGGKVPSAAPRRQTQAAPG